VRFSVVIPTRDRASEVVTALRSALDQTCTDLEVVVVDDGSTDATASVVAAVDDPRLVYVAESGRGGNVARNAGARASRGDLLAFLDDDDEVEATWLESLDAALRSEPSAVVACCGATYVEPDGTTSVKLPADLGPAFDHAAAHFDTGTFVVDRRVFEEVGGFAEDLPSMQQTDLALRLVAACRRRAAPIAVVAAALVRVHQRPASDRGRNDPEKLVTATTVMLQRHAALMARDPKMVADYHAIAGVGAARLGRPREARRHLAAAVRTQPGRPVHWARLAVACVPVLARRIWRWDAQAS
jgi:glycosyltransferase involved in cell wall biosynthesis